MTSMIETVARWMCEADNGSGHSDRWTHYARMAKAAIAALQAQPADPSDTGDFVPIPVEVYEFLMGQGPLEGCQFGEQHPGRPGEFWWRAVIQERGAAHRSMPRPAHTP